MKNVYIVGGGYSEKGLFKDLGYAITKDANEADLAVFTGGADISPSLYGDKKHASTYTNPSRDEMEVKMYNLFLKKNIPMVGICRGGQLLNIMAGGRMYQHINKHAGGGHSITDLETGDVIQVNSIHHQMMMPTDKAKIVAVANLGGFREWYDGQVFKRDTSKEDIEVVFYAETKALCFQPHPEYAGAEYEQMKQYFGVLIKKYLEV